MKHFVNSGKKMLQYILFVCLLHTVFAVKNTKNYFCNLKCGSDHTVCKRMPCVVSKACGKGGKALPLDDASRKWILDVHNNKRNSLALGRDTTGGNGQAANMRVLSYDKEIEFVAQCWANACADTGNSHDVCRDTRKFSYVGQNMFSSGSSVNQDWLDNKWLTKAVDTWYGEISLSNPSEIDSYEGRRGTGHFTQVIWAETTHIGCGRTFYMSKSGFYSVYIYCNYGKGGNELRAPVYLRGPPCSKCGSSSCNKQYPALCGRINNLEEDRWLAPFRMSGSRLQCCFYNFVILIIVFYLV